SPRSPACMTRLKSRSNRSRGVIRLMSGAAPAVPAANGARPSPPAPLPLSAPELAMSGATGAGAPRTTFNRMVARSARHRTPAATQAVRSRAGRGARCPGAPPGAAGRPQRWQKRAWGERSARQAGQLRAIRLAPHELQKLPEAGLPQAGQGAGEVMAAEA